MIPRSEPLGHAAQGTVQVKGGAVEIAIEWGLGSIASTTRHSCSGSHLEPQLSGNRDKMIEVILSRRAKFEPSMNYKRLYPKLTNRPLGDTGACGAQRRAIIHPVSHSSLVGIGEQALALPSPAVPLRQ